MLSVGQKAPNFQLPSTSGEIFDLHDAFKKTGGILYFYPKDMTPGCTKEACSFRDEYSVFKDAGLPVVGVSRDSMEKHLRFKEKNSLPFELLTDESGNVCRAYEALVPIIGMVKRVSYLIGEDMKVKAAFSDLFGADKHIAEMKRATQAAS